MKVFISWSGDRSKAVAEALRAWMPLVIQQVQPWMSENDLPGGKRWGLELAKRLEDSKAGVVVVTRENQTSPWLNFEAGALAKAVDDSWVIPLVVDMRLADLKKPLGEFQAREATQEGVFKLMHDVNKALADQALTDHVVDALLEALWPKLEASLSVIPAPRGKAPPARTTEEMAEETLVAVRQLSRNFADLQHAVLGERFARSSRVDVAGAGGVGGTVELFRQRAQMGRAEAKIRFQAVQAILDEIGKRNRSLRVSLDDAMARFDTVSESGERTAGRDKLRLDAEISRMQLELSEGEERSAQLAAELAMLSTFI